MTATLVLGLLRKVICVAKRVQSPLSRGKGKPVRPSSTELLPLRRLSVNSSLATQAVNRLTWIDHRQQGPVDEYSLVAGQPFFSSEDVFT